MATAKSIKFKSIYRCSLSGLSHHAYAMYARQIEPGDEIILDRDVGNRYDDFAIRASYEGEQIGWIPKGQNEIIARLLDAGLDIRAKVISHEKSKPLDQRVYVVICIAVEE